MIIIQESYKPKRVFKKPTKFTQADEETQVQSTLLEYGQRYGFNNKAMKEETEAKQKAIAAGLVKLQDPNSGNFKMANCFKCNLWYTLFFL